MRLLALIHAAFHRPETTVYRWVNGLVWLLIFLSVGLFAVQLGLDVVRIEDSALALVDDVILVAFAVEIVLRVLSYVPRELHIFELSEPARLRIHLNGRLRFLLSPLILVDLFTVLALVPELRGLRALRLLRLVRTADLFRYSRPFARIARGFHENRLPFLFAFSLLGVEVLLGGLSIWLVEGGAHPDIQTLGDGFWWALVTITTVGFGDITPLTELGRIIGAVVMIGGMFTLALFAGIVGHVFLNILISLREEQYRMADYLDHVVICGYNAGARALLDQLLRELPKTTTMVVIAEGERDPAVPPEVAWVSGDPTKEAELDKVRLSHAALAIVVAPRMVPPQQADATTLLIVFTLRRYLRGLVAAGATKRKKPLWIVAEVLDEENVEHARTAGADEVIESTTIAFSLLAHAAAMPGSAAILGRVATAGALNLYLGVRPAGAAEVTRFGELARYLKAHHDALLIGLHDPDTHADTFNPPDEHVVPGRMALIYLAVDAVLPAPS
ncbi:MAG: hypothetical protein EP329_18260 [Deltaproteobacteria bacterium]|nr:MAG: hypothetical protein EP329_18260 [Deltaproteobacteria bacterium]